MTPEAAAEKVVVTWGVWSNEIYLATDELQSLIASAIRDAYERAATENQCFVALLDYIYENRLAHLFDVELLAVCGVRAAAIRALKGEG